MQRLKTSGQIPSEGEGTAEHPPVKRPNVHEQTLSEVERIHTGGTNTP